MKDYRAIVVEDEMVMLVHSSVTDEMIERVMKKYEYEILMRLVKNKIDGKDGKTGEVGIYHRMNLFKKLVRLDNDLNGFVNGVKYTVEGPVFDCKDWKKKDEGVLRREFKKFNEKQDKYSRMVAVIETQEEIEFYSKYGVIREVIVWKEKVMFVRMVEEKEGESKLNYINLYSNKERKI
jgi:hypothetical protein